MKQEHMNLEISMIRNQWWNRHDGRHVIDWSLNEYWPTLLAEIVAHGYFAVRLCYCALDKTWQVETEMEVDSEPVVWATNDPQTEPGGAVCEAWLRWMFEEKGVWVQDGQVHRLQPAAQQVPTS